MSEQGPMTASADENILINPDSRMSMFFQSHGRASAQLSYLTSSHTYHCVPTDI